jgi:cation:H+ antiporter
LAFLLLVLVKSSDYFVDSVARIARYLGVSEFVIGLTIISIGTTLPELTSSTIASFAGATELAVGNFVGSVIANIGLILGISAMISVIKTNRHIFLRDCLILVSVSLVFFFFSADGTISRLDGAILFLIGPAYMAYLFKFNPHLRRTLYHFRTYLKKIYGIRPSLRKPGRRLLEEKLKEKDFEDFVGTGFDLETFKEVDNRISKFKAGIVKDMFIALVAAGGLYISARFLVPLAVEIAVSFGVSENVIGATLIAIGTSLPELFVALSSIRKGFYNIILGNMVGAGIFNLTLVAGLSALINPLNILPVTMAVSLPIMLLVTWLLFVFSRTEWRIRWFEGAVLLSLYSLFIYLLLTARI